MIEGACVPLMAKARWPQIGPDTRIALTPTWMYVVPIVDDYFEPGVSVMERWTRPPLWTSYSQEEIALHETAGIPGIDALGYGVESDTLVIKPAGRDSTID